MAMDGKTRWLRTAREDEELLAEVHRMYPRMPLIDMLRAALRYGLIAAQTKPAEVLLGAQSEPAQPAG